MSVCCSPALQEPAVPVEPVALLKPSKASPKPPVCGGRAAAGLRQRGSCGRWCREPGKRVCMMIHPWLGLTTEKNECVGYLSFIWARILSFIVARLDCRSGRGAAMRLLIATASSA